MNILEELKLSKKQNNNKRYDYLCQQFNAVDYAIKLEKYTIKLQQEMKKVAIQQKEFIKYLEDEIKRINPKELYISELNLRLDDIKFTQYLIYKEILQKYRNITGVSDEKEN